MNPAVSLAMVLTGRMYIKRFFVYVASQLIGAFLAALFVFIVYLDGLKNYKPGMYSLDSAGEFCKFETQILNP